MLTDSKTKTTAEGDNNVVQAESASQRKDAAKVITLIDKAIKSVTEANVTVHEAAMACIKHYEKYQDARLMDRLVKGLPESYDKQPLIFWVRQNSPIRWDAKKQIKVLKEGDPDFKELDVEAAEQTPFHATPEAARRRETAIQPFNAKFIFDKIKNFKRQLENSLQEDTRRPFDNSYGDEDQIKEFLEELNEFITPFEEKAEKVHKVWMKKVKEEKGKEPTAHTEQTHSSSEGTRTIGSKSVKPLPAASKAA